MPSGNIIKIYKAYKPMSDRFSECKMIGSFVDEQEAKKAIKGMGWRGLSDGKIHTVWAIQVNGSFYELKSVNPIVVTQKS